MGNTPISGIHGSVINTGHVGGHLINAQNVTGDINTSGNVTSGADLASILSELRQAISSLPLEAATSAEVNEKISDLEEELKSPKPHRKWIEHSLKFLRETFVRVSGTFSADKVRELLAKLESFVRNHAGLG